MTAPLGGGRSLADVFVQLHVDSSRVPREVRNATEKQIGDAGEQAGNHFGKRMAAAIGAAALAGSVFIGAKLVQGFTGAVQSASDLNETMAKTNTLFGKSAGSVKQWAKNMASDFGQSQKTALDGAATFAIYGNAAKLTGKDLFNFSTDLVGLASDMASFSNTSPEEAIEAIGAAMRGEADPIEKYGVLMNEATLKSVAMRKGIIKTTKEALTPQQRVLAVQALLFEQLGNKGSKTLGDFERNSQSLANQQRIAKANTENLRAEIGQAFLPVVEKLYQQFNTKVIPVLQELWREHGPAVTAWASGAAGSLGTLADKIDGIDFAALAATIQDKIVPAIKEFKGEAGSGLSDTLKVTTVAMKFLADNADTLGKALPYLIAGFIAYKTVMAASNAVAVVSPIITLANVFAQRKLAAANLQLAAAVTTQSTATRAATASTAANTVAENTGMLTRIRSTAATIASTVAQKAIRGATIAWTAVQWALNTALLANPIGLVIAAIVALIAIVVLAYKKNETFRKIVDAVWAGIKKAIKAVGDWFVNTLWPSLKKAFDQLISVGKFLWNTYISIWKGIFNAINTAWSWIRDKVFSPMKNFITKTIPDAFRAGVGGIKTWWDKLQGYAKAPVKFVIETVINRGLIGTFNKVSGFFGGPKLNPVPGIGDGHGHPGGAGGGGKPKKGEGDGFGDVLSFFRGPASYIRSKVTSKIDAVRDRFGNNPLTKVLTGTGKKLLGSLIEKAKSMLELGSPGGGGVGAGGLRGGIRAVMGGMRSVFGTVPIISGLRPGAVTTTGNRSYHALGRAVDLRPYLPWAQYLNAVWGSRLRELITPWQHLNILNGRPHTYTGSVWRTHNFAGGNAHIHAAMDDGGMRTLLPGLNIIPNGTGAKEPIYGPAEIGEVVALLKKLLEAMDRLGPAIGRELTGATAHSLTLARARGAVR